MGVATLCNISIGGSLHPKKLETRWSAELGVQSTSQMHHGICGDCMDFGSRWKTEYLAILEVSWKLLLTDKLAITEAVIKSIRPANGSQEELHPQDDWTAEIWDARLGRCASTQYCSLWSPTPGPTLLVHTVWQAPQPLDLRYFSPPPCLVLVAQSQQ